MSKKGNGNLNQVNLDLGKYIQQLLLPRKNVGKFASFQYETKYLPAQIMSGDWLYIWRVSEEKKRLYLGDVMGKGPGAALPMAIIISTLNECELANSLFIDSIFRINKKLIEMFKSKVITTCSSIEINRSGKVTLFNASSPGWFSHKNGTTKGLFLRNKPLGIYANLDPALHEFYMNPGETLFTFSDGYIESSRALKRFFLLLQKNESVQNEGNLIHNLLIDANSRNNHDDDRSMIAISRF